MMPQYSPRPGSLHLGTSNKSYFPTKNNHVVAVDGGSYFELVRKVLWKACAVNYREGGAGKSQRRAALVSNHSKESCHKARTERTDEC